MPSKKGSSAGDTKKSMDVSKPGKVAPPSSGRPILVSHRPIVEDPMMRSSNNGDATSVPGTEGRNQEINRMLNPSRSRVKVEPLNESKDSQPAKGPEHAPGSVVSPVDEPTEDAEADDPKEEKETAPVVEEPEKNEVPDTKQEEPKADETPEPIDEKVKEPEDSSGDEGHKITVVNKSKKTEPSEPEPTGEPVAEEPDETLTDAKSKDDEPGSSDKSTDDEPAEPEKPDAAGESAPASDETPKDGAEEKPDSDTSEPQSEGIVDELAKQAASKKKQAEQDKESAARIERANALIESRTYYVPVGQLTKKRHTRLVLFMLLLVIILGLAGLNFAVDAGLIKTDIKPLTNVFKN